MEKIQTLSQAEVMEILPHRDPILFIDSVSELIPGERVVAHFAVKPDLDVFRGHFPDDPILPGVYIVEAAAQASDLIMMTLDRYRDKTPLFFGIDAVRFYQKIRKGDVLDIHSKLVKERVEKGIGVCKATVYVKGSLVTECDIVLAMR